MKIYFFKLESYGIEWNLLRLLKNYLTECQQRVVLNGQTSSWLNVTASVPPLLFLIYINDLTDEITSSCKIFADDTSVFWEIGYKSYCNFQLNKDLETISKCAFQWKILSSP